ncbi:keratin-associated protein 13-1-like [Physeter macrocephalus]|uniref:Keratin-associated protein n=1 Tax=Physeter macrocephalus TaxID=9755 RepID=A0A2Y9FM32_PHYMC|nr:keratin-associated protein 13-1-like [Physeter catodon]|eukprot:XP_007126536.1 keratin-associated protein 13-1-like [Physeter catodon]
MSYNCCSGNFSSCSLGSHLCYPGSFYSSNLVYSTDLYSRSTCQLGSSLYSSCQETCYEPTMCQAFSVVSSPCQTSCYCPTTSTIYHPCYTIYAGSLGFRSSRGCSLSSGSRSFYSLACGSSGFRHLGYSVWGSPTLGYGSRFCHPPYFDFQNCQSSFYQPACGSYFWGLMYLVSQETHHESFPCN